MIMNTMSKMSIMPSTMPSIIYNSLLLLSLLRGLVGLWLTGPSSMIGGGVPMECFVVYPPRGILAFRLSVKAEMERIENRDTQIYI